MLNWSHQEIAQVTNSELQSGSLADALVGADIFIGVSRPGVVTKSMIETMNKDSVVYAMANPTPEIFPEEAKAGGAKIIGTGRSDYPNQDNNVLAFPGIFKGALAVKAREVNEEMKLAAAKALAGLIPEDQLTETYVISGGFDHGVADAVADAVAKAAKDTQVNRI